MARFSKEPTFVRQVPTTQISELALRVVVEFPSRELHVIGTATIIVGGLAITARHVLDDIVSRFGSRKIEAQTHDVEDYAIRLYQVLPGPEYAIWQVATAWPCLDTDIAFLQFKLYGYSGLSAPTSYKLPRINVVPPPVGAAVVGFGYHSSVASVTPTKGGFHISLNDEPTATTGEVEEVLENGNPSGRFSFPCYRINARFDGGMSGGPVIDEHGLVCGIISGTYGEWEGVHTSYVATLWPMLRTVISANRKGEYPRNVNYPVIDLALDGLIQAVGLNELDQTLFPGRTLPRE